MEKQRLTTLINQPEKLDENDFNSLLKLKQEFPYFQAIFPLITLGSKKFAPAKEKKYTQSAAIGVLDRKHLKEILTTDFEEVNTDKTEVKEVKLKTKSPQSHTDEPKTNANSETKKEVIPTSPTEGKNKIEATEPLIDSHLPDSFFSELMKEMEELKAEKENYLKTLERIESLEEKPKTRGTKKTSSTKNTTKKASSPKKTTAKKPSTAKKSNTGKTKAASTSAKSNTAKKTSSTVKKTIASKKPSVEEKKTSSAKAKSSTKKSESETTKKNKNEEVDLIQEIRARKELKISDSHKKEQLDIINNFIENEPVLTRRIDSDNQSNKQEAEDLSASSTNLSDDVVSETLAKLMIKQGRKQKAIDIYKKLIWKFPQKKTYFVEIIDELKKQS
ncbi:hypothetical protein QYS48_22270 [Marivirga arenosa]|uniref:Tetratricopeptide repeat protein n=1 Tax=Marivirga arenosa TaxID=3059076 RepID=A0AA49JA49_9BACT|nr:hypothetical protein [Marivirga sp. ABR2-2]WKK84805.1 hypothetical protein QYS48_22270 [Marivirga sp. ABR2-2]